MSWELIDVAYREIATVVFDTLDGDRSTVSLRELDRRIRVRLREDGCPDPVTPQRMTQEYCHPQAPKGCHDPLAADPGTAEGIRVASLSGVRPGQVVAIDATRADNLVFAR